MLLTVLRHFFGHRLDHETMELPTSYEEKKILENKIKNKMEITVLR